MFGANYFYLDPDLKHVYPSKFKEAKTTTDSDTYKDGDIVEAWDHVFRWNKYCVPLRKWEEWRNLSDDLADAALPAILGEGGGTDLLSRLELAATQPNPDPSVQRFWAHLHSGFEQPLWPSREQVLRGQAVFYRYAPQILASLLQFSLSSGFSSPRVSRILNIASYLVPPMESTPEGQSPRITKESNDRSFQRLMETTQWLVDCMGEGAMEPKGAGWSSTVRVRLLHTMMRQRILEKSRREWEATGFSLYNEKSDGIPISQEDMISTLNSFTSAPLLCMVKTGITPLPEECEDWTALWRVIGYYFGIKQTILENHFSNWQTNKYIGASNIVSMFAGEADPPPPCHFPFEMGLIPDKNRVKRLTSENPNADAYVTPATLPVLFCICNRWPVPFNFAQHCTAARHLMGKTLSDWLSVPRTTFRDEVEYKIGMTLTNLPSLFARNYRRGWDAKRRDAMRRSVESAVRYELGNRSSKFRPRGPDAFIPIKEGDEFAGIEHNRDIQVAIHEWLVLYGEVMLIAIFVMFFWPLLLGPLVLYFLWKKLSQAVTAFN